MSDIHANDELKKKKNLDYIYILTHPMHLNVFRGKKIK